MWNAAEKARTRKNATVGRELEIALPAELGPGAREALVMNFARELVATASVRVPLTGLICLAATFVHTAEKLSL